MGDVLLTQACSRSMDATAAPYDNHRTGTTNKDAVLRGSRRMNPVMQQETIRLHAQIASASRANLEAGRVAPRCASWAEKQSDHSNHRIPENGTKMSFGSPGALEMRSLAEF